MAGAASGVYGEMPKLWSGDDVKGYSTLAAIPSRLHRQAGEGGKSEGLERPCRQDRPQPIGSGRGSGSGRGKKGMKVRVHKIASVVYRLGFEKEVEITEALEPRAGHSIVVRALSEKRVYSELELQNGRMSKIFRGDITVGALGRRRALRGYSGMSRARSRWGTRSSSSTGEG